MKSEILYIMGAGRSVLAAFVVEKVQVDRVSRATAGHVSAAGIGPR